MLHKAHVESARLPETKREPKAMSRGPSGRIVVEVDPALKKRLHAALALDGTTLKDWLRQQAEAYLTGHQGLAEELASDRRDGVTATRKGSQVTVLPRPADCEAKEP